MFALRYVALAALAVWVGGLVLLLLIGDQHVDAARALHRIALFCGFAVVVTLSATKLLGPPPAAYPVRVLVSAAMLLMTLLSGFAVVDAAAKALNVVNTVAGLFLLSFYARE